MRDSSASNILAFLYYSVCTTLLLCQKTADVSNRDGHGTKQTPSTYVTYENNLTVFDVGGLHVELYDNVFTVHSLNVSIYGSEEGEIRSSWSSANNFSFVPQRNTPKRGCHNLGDITLRVRPVEREYENYGEWALFSSVAASGKLKAKVVNQNDSDSLLAHDITSLIEEDLSHSIPVFRKESPVKIVRSWHRRTNANKAENLVLQFDITNTFNSAIELGALGFSLPAAGMPIVNITDIHQAVWEDPHIGLDHGWVEWVRIIDDERVLLAIPELRDEKGVLTYTSQFEAWRPIMENVCGDDVWEYDVFSLAWSEEWKRAQQYPFLYMADFLNKTGMWPNPQTPWPAWRGHESVPLINIEENAFRQPFNVATSRMLQPHETVTSAIKFILARGGPRTRDEALKDAGSAIIKAEPGYVLSSDMKSARMLVRPPRGARIKEIMSSNEEALRCGECRNLTADSRILSDWVQIPLRASAGKNSRCRLTILFDDTTKATIHFAILGSRNFEEQIEKLSKHWSLVAWLPRNYPDPFGRGASVMPWDKQDKNYVFDDSRAYDCGISDDAGGANPLGLAIKVYLNPNDMDASRVDEFVRYTLYGVKEGLQECTCFDPVFKVHKKCDCAKPPFKSLQIRPVDLVDDTSKDLDGIRMTLYYYYFEHDNPKNSSSGTHVVPNSSGHFEYKYSESNKCFLPGIEGGPNWCMSEILSNATYRIYNYPHHTASYLSLYRASRNHERLSRTLSHDWQWYLMRAANTTLRFGSPLVGVMDGTIFREVLRAVKEESKIQLNTGVGVGDWNAIATAIDRNMANRAKAFNASADPLTVSEYPFDTVSQEEMVVWLLEYAGDVQKGDTISKNTFVNAANRTVNHILSFMRSSPTWAYHGGSRSWGDVGNNGKWMPSSGTTANFQTRGNFHYRAGLNSIPLLEFYRRDPDDYNAIMLLEIGLGAQAGTLMSIDSDTGEPSMALHMLPHILDYDPHSGDFGLGFFGHSLEAASYVVFDNKSFDGLGLWMCYLCNYIEERPRRLDESLSTAEALNYGPFSISPVDSYRSKVFLEPLGLYINMDTGKIKRVDIDLRRRTIMVHFDLKNARTYNTIRMRLEKTCSSKIRPGVNFSPKDRSPHDTNRGAFTFEYGTERVEIGWNEK